MHNARGHAVIPPHPNQQFLDSTLIFSRKPAQEQFGDALVLKHKKPSTGSDA